MSFRHVTICDQCGAWDWADAVNWEMSEPPTQQDPFSSARVPIIDVRASGTDAHNTPHYCGKCRDSVRWCAQCKGYHASGERCPADSSDLGFDRFKVDEMPSLFTRDDPKPETPGVKIWKETRGRPADLKPPAKPSESRSDLNKVLLLILLAIGVLFLYIVTR